MKAYVAIQKADQGKAGGVLLRWPAMQLPADVADRLAGKASRPFALATKGFRTFYASLCEAAQLGYLQPLSSQDAKLMLRLLFGVKRWHLDHLVIAETHSHATGVDRAPPQVFSSFHLEQQTLKRLVKAGATTVATLLDNGYLSSHVSLARHTLVRQSQSLGRITLDKNSSMVKPEEITAFMAGELSSVLDQAEELSF